MRLVLSALVLVACGRNDAAAPPPPAKAAAEVKRVGLDEIDAPHHDAASMAGSADQFLVVQAKGSLTASLNGIVTPFEFLPTGSNAAILKEDKGIARVSIGGAPTPNMSTTLAISLEGVRLDRLTLPATLTTTGADAEDGSRVRIEYMIGEQKTWVSEPGGSIVIESYAGKRVTGTFAGKLVARSAAFGPPIDVADGRFDVELRLNGAPPGPS